MIPLGNAGSAADTASQSMETATTGTIGHGAKPGQDVQDPTVLPVDALVTPTITVPEATAPAGRQPRLWLVETPALRPYTQAEFAAGDCLLFGNESRGLPPSLRQRFADSLIGIPMPAGKVRSLNLATAVAIVLYDALRRIHRW
ncbi:MAG: hypothetical protein NZ703_11180 [Gemmataceae bacterium]|nr:hypothetical protein [Gemmataceae bacterium]